MSFLNPAWAVVIIVVKLAGEEDFHDGMQVPLLHEPNDSGIDSDEAVRERARANPLGGILLNRGGSSDEEPVDRQWPRRRKYDDQMSSFDAERLVRKVLLPLLLLPYHVPVIVPPITMRPESPNQASPPLSEVELTASDEEEDGSVLELVIPVQSAKYKRVPNSSPKKPNIFIRLFWKICCCYCLKY